MSTIEDTLRARYRELHSPAAKKSTAELQAASSHEQEQERGYQALVEKHRGNWQSLSHKEKVSLRDALRKANSDAAATGSMAAHARDFELTSKLGARR